MVNEFRINNDILIPQLLSPDNRFVIFLDELYDIKNKRNLGNIWENFENLKFFLRYSFNNSELDKNIVESANKILNGHLITESVENILDFKPYIKEYLCDSVTCFFSFTHRYKIPPKVCIINKII
jgi:hypothetical protein